MKSQLVFQDFTDEQLKVLQHFSGKLVQYYLEIRDLMLQTTTGAVCKSTSQAMSEDK